MCVRHTTFLVGAFLLTGLVFLTALELFPDHGIVACRDKEYAIPLNTSLILHLNILFKYSIITM